MVTGCTYIQAEKVTHGRWAPPTMRRRGFESDWKIFETKQAKQKNQLSRKVEHKKLKTTSNES